MQSFLPRISHFPLGTGYILYPPHFSQPFVPGATPNHVYPHPLNIGAHYTLYQPCPIPSTLYTQSHFQIGYPSLSFSQPIRPFLPIATPNNTHSNSMPLFTGYTPYPSNFPQPYVPRAKPNLVYPYPLN